MALWLAGPAWALAPEVTVTRVFQERGSFVSLAEDDSTDGAKRWVLGGTSVEGFFRFYLARVDSAGDSIAAFRYGSTDRLTALTRAADGTAAMVGWTTENDTPDYKLMRASSDGELVTNWPFGSTTTADVTYDVIEFPPTWYLVAGKATPGIEGRSDATLVHISQNGSVQWSRTYAGAERACAVALGDSGRILICATADSLDTLRLRDAAMIRADSAGEQITLRRIGGPREETINSALRISASRTILVGSTVAPAGDKDFWIVVTNDSGDSLWSRSWGTSADDAALGVTQAHDADSGFVVAGWSDGVIANTRSGLLLKFDQDGDSLWAIVVGDTGYTTELADVVQDSAFAYRAVGMRHTQFDHPLYVQTQTDPRAGGNQPPGHFALLAPEDQDTLSQDTILFDWETAVDPDSGEQIRYALLLDSDTLFQSPRAIGPLMNSQYTWVTDSDDVRIFWRVVAQDPHNLVRICDDRSRSFVLIRPDSTGPFSLASPDSGVALAEPFTVFRWQRAADPDLNDTLRYTIHFATADSSFEITGLQDTFIAVTFVNHPVVDPAEEVEWWVTVHSVNPVMQRDSREHWTFVTWSSGANDVSGIPLAFGLHTAYPNPFNAATTLEFAVERPSDVRLDIFDVEGRRVTTLVNGHFPAGGYRMNWNASAAASGIYFARLMADDQVRTLKLMLLR